MKRSWNWDFEEESRARRAPAPPRALDRVPVVVPADLRAQFRRRRGGAALVIVLIVLVGLVALLGSHHHAPSASHARTDSSRGSGAGAAPQGAAGDPVKAVLAYTPFVVAGAPQGRDIALTFDDGPGPYTPEVLSVLEQDHVPATFFAIGKMERYFSDSTQREIHDGDVVGDHTQSHVALATLPAREQREQLFEGIARIELAGGPRPELFRPPYGSFDATTLSELRSLGLLMVLWSVDTGDYLQPGIPAIVEHALAGARPGAIILMHDGGGNRAETIAALPQIIHALRRRGYVLVTVPRLLRDDPPPAGQPIPHSLAGD